MAREMACVYYDNQKCKKFEEPGYVSWCVLGPCSHQVPSRADKIRAMSDEELAAMFAEICRGMEFCDFCPAVCDGRCPEERVDLWLNWFRQPADSTEGEL